MGRYWTVCMYLSTVIFCTFTQFVFLNDQIIFYQEFCCRKSSVNVFIPLNMKKAKVLVEPISILNMSPNVNENINSLNMLGNCSASDKLFLQKLPNPLCFVVVVIWFFGPAFRQKEISKSQLPAQESLTSQGLFYH